MENIEKKHYGHIQLYISHTNKYKFKMSNYLKLINDYIINKFKLEEENMETYLNNPSEFDKLIALDFNTKMPFDDSLNYTYKFYNITKFHSKIINHTNSNIDVYMLNSLDIFNICIQKYKIRNNDMNINNINMFGIYYDILNNAIRIEKYGYFVDSFIRRTKNNSIKLVDNFEELEQYIKIVEIYPKIIYLFG